MKIKRIGWRKWQNKKKEICDNLDGDRLCTAIKTEKKDKYLKTKDERNHVFDNVQMYSMVDPWILTIPAFS